MTYDMSDLTYFHICEVNIIPFFLLGSRTGLGVSLNSHTSVMNGLLVLPLHGEDSNELRRLGYFWEMNEHSTIMFKKFETGCQN